MAERSPRRPATPKQYGPHSVVRYMDRYEEIEEIVQDMNDQDLEDPASPQNARTKVKSVRRIQEQEYSEPHLGRQVSLKKRIFGSRRDKSPKRPPTPKREQIGRHTINVDKGIQKAVKKILEKEYPDVPYPGDLPSRASKRPPTPKREQSGPNAVVLDENTREVVRKHLEENDHYYNHPGDIPKLETIEVGEAKPRMGQVSPISPNPQPLPLFPAEEIKKKNADPKYNLQEALLTSGRVGRVAVPASDTAEPRLSKDSSGGGIGGLIRTFSGRFKKKSKKKEEEVVPEPDIDLSTTDTSVQYSTSLGSELFEDRDSDTYTPSSVTPGLDMSWSKIEELNREYENLSDSFPSETEGAVGGVEPEQAGASSPEQLDPSVRLPKSRSTRRTLETWEEDPYDDYELPRTRTSGLRGEEPTPNQRRELDNRLKSSAVKDKAYWDRRYRNLQLERYQTFGRAAPEFLEEFRANEWRSDKKLGRTFERTQVVTYRDDIKKGVLQTPDGNFEVEYTKKPNNEMVVIRTFPLPSSGIGVQTSPGRELPKQKPSIKFEVKQEVGMHPSTPSAGSAFERPYYSKVYPVRRATALDNLAPTSNQTESRISSGSDSDSDVDQV